MNNFVWIILQQCLGDLMLKINNQIIKGKILFADNIFSKAFGLMFKRNFKNKFLIFIFKKEIFVPLHMFFVFFPIDVIFLNKDKIVVEIKNNFKPFTYYNPIKKAKYVIEAEKNIFKNVKLDDKIDFNF
jgi:uncharacterized protein